MTACAKCKIEVRAAGEFAMCAPCFTGWPKGASLQHYVDSDLPPKPSVRRMPEHLALTLRRSFNK